MHPSLHNFSLFWSVSQICPKITTHLEFLKLWDKVVPKADLLIVVNWGIYTSVLTRIVLYPYQITCESMSFNWDFNSFWVSFSIVQLFSLNDRKYTAKMLTPLGIIEPIQGLPWQPELLMGATNWAPNSVKHVKISDQHAKNSLSRCEKAESLRKIQLKFHLLLLLWIRPCL